ncbi:Adaptive-response sensory-kinase SasA [Pseudoalteromonas holothuriae]|uniref:histidine kinase n=1 Tax=Pseudoalteromonas holothuriae TaxID=2963714 RepID=A0A9W4QR59_9GAMM|nr:MULTISPECIES: ATP-binding protein [unclassified Pseudoalteromonas]CAH9049709.1 Adaptive-response sensory-kinase SasA [Pseudoalteromonas sp. CIP111854]CAH9051680.1 Adaptive-response sensory-kinase SasA [Pseudoalteromonas sp. CIP111951]
MYYASEQMFKRLFIYCAAAFTCSIFIAVILLDTKYVDIRVKEERPIVDSIFSVINKQAAQAPIDQDLLHYWSGQFGYELELLSIQNTQDLELDLAQLTQDGSVIELISGWTQDKVTAYYLRNEQILKMSKMHIDKQAYLLYWQSLLVTILVVLALFVYCYVHMHKKYIKKLLNAYETYGQGKLSLRVSTQMPAPYSVLASHFNTMATKIENLLEEHQHMLNGISHDLKTPLARLRFALDMTRSCTSTEEYQETIQFMDEDLDALDELLDDWFLYVGLNAARREPKVQTCRLDKMLHKIVSRSAPIYSNIKAVSQITPDIVVGADKKLLSRAVENLVNNACKFASQTIRVSTHLDNDYVCIVVEDDGAGIPEDKRAAVLKPFLRLDSSRNVPGIGLGLSIVASILNSHNGKLNICDSDLGGAKITLMLPINCEAELATSDACAL